MLALRSPWLCRTERLSMPEKSAENRSWSFWTAKLTLRLFLTRRIVTNTASAEVITPATLSGGSATILLALLISVLIVFTECEDQGYTR